MRIIAGSAKGTKLDAPRHGTRPMTGRAKESLFSILGGSLVGANVLDLYAGSGSLGLEALSRGAKSCVFVERGRDALTCLRRNIERVGLGGVVVPRSVESMLGSTRAQFDVVFVDPPYAETDRAVGTVLGAVVPCMNPDAVVVVHRQSRSAMTLPDILTRVDERKYGDAVVTMIQRNPS